MSACLWQLQLDGVTEYTSFIIPSFRVVRMSTLPGQMKHAEPVKICTMSRSTWHIAHGILHLSPRCHLSTQRNRNDAITCIRSHRPNVRDTIAVFLSLASRRPDLFSHAEASNDKIRAISIVAPPNAPGAFGTWSHCFQASGHGRYGSPHRPQGKFRGMLSRSPFLSQTYLDQPLLNKPAAARSKQPPRCSASTTSRSHSSLVLSTPDSLKCSQLTSAFCSFQPPPNPPKNHGVFPAITKESPGICIGTGSSSPSAMRRLLQLSPPPSPPPLG